MPKNYGNSLVKKNNKLNEITLILQGNYEESDLNELGGAIEKVLFFKYPLFCKRASRAFIFKCPISFFLNINNKTKKM